MRAEPILIVEDDPDGLGSAGRYRQLQRFHVHEASDGAAASSLASTTPSGPRVSFMDLDLGGLDGLEITRPHAGRTMCPRRNRKNHLCVRGGCKD